MTTICDANNNNADSDNNHNYSNDNNAGGCGCVRSHPMTAFGPTVALRGQCRTKPMLSFSTLAPAPAEGAAVVVAMALLLVKRDDASNSTYAAAIARSIQQGASLDVAQVINRATQYITHLTLVCTTTEKPFNGLQRCGREHK